MLDRIKAVMKLAIWIALVAVAVVGLHALAGVFPASAVWLSTSPEVALGAAARLLGLAAGYWLLGSTSVYVLGRVVRFPAAAKAVDWATLPWVRRIADRLTARALVRVLATPLPLLELVTPGYVPVPSGEPTTAAPSGRTSVTTTPVTAPSDESHGAGMVEVVVQPGDHMWSLASTRLAQATGRAPTNSEVSPYWRRVVEANRDRIRSGDPDLIFPGEVLILPGL